MIFVHTKSKKENPVYVYFISRKFHFHISEKGDDNLPLTFPLLANYNTILLNTIPKRPMPYRVIIQDSVRRISELSIAYINIVVY